MKMICIWIAVVLLTYVHCSFFSVDDSSKLDIFVHREKGALFRMITYTPQKDLPSSYKILSKDELNVIFVGARENLYKFKLGNISKVTKQSFPLNKRLYDICMTTQSNFIEKDIECKNQVWNVMYTDDHRLTICESQAFQPRLRYVDIKTMKPISDEAVEGIEGDGYTTCDARASKSKGNVFFHQISLNNKATVFTYLRYQYRMSFTNKIERFYDNLRVYKNSVNRTLEYKEDDMRIGFGSLHQFRDAVFIRSMIIGKFVYIFYTELTNQKNGNLDPDIQIDRTVTRISRFCKTDAGFPELNIAYITSFTKATLTCKNQQKRDHDFKYELMKDISYDDVKKEFIAIFYEYRDYTSTALCTFSLASMNEVLSSFLFNEYYKYKTDHYFSKINRSSMTKEECPGVPYSDRLMQYSLHATLSYKDLEATVLYQVDIRRAQLHMLTSHVYPNGDRVVFAFDANDVMLKFSQKMGSDFLLVSSQNTTIQGITDIRMIDQNIYGISDNAVFMIDIKSQCINHVSCFTCSVDLNCMWSKSPVSSCVANDLSKTSNIIRGNSFDAVEDECIADCQTSEETIDVSMLITSTILPYNNKCNTKYNADTDVWFLENNPVPVTDEFYSISSTGNLINLITKSSDTFTLKRNDRNLKTIKLVVTECTTPNCHFRKEFHNWCTAFSTYKKDYTNWRCLKDNCVNDPNCIPNSISKTCAKP